MGQSIFDIQKDYLDLIDSIESNQGDITEDLGELLAITEEDFKTKMVAYENSILTLESEILLAKNQIDKFTAKIKSKQNTIDRLKAVMLGALKLMGETGKKGNRILKTPEFSFFTKDTTTVEVDPLKFTLADERTHNYAKVKLPLELTPAEYNALKDFTFVPALDNEGNITKTYEAMVSALEKIRGSIYSVQPDKKLLTATLSKAKESNTQSEISALFEDLANTSEEGEETKTDTALIPGVTLITNTSIQVK